MPLTSKQIITSCIYKLLKTGQLDILLLTQHSVVGASSGLNFL